MKTYKQLWNELCSYDNLFLAYKKARKHKTTKDYVIHFEKNLEHNLLLLCSELLLHSYNPKPLVNFIIRDPKTRRISKSHFRDRIVHHALCNIIEPIFEKSFIHDSYANRKNKGTLKAVERFDYFKRKASKNNSTACYILKVDIRKYFENIDHEILCRQIKKKIADERVLWLVKKILVNYTSDTENKGMPLGNLTSQFFANVYLNKLDWFVKDALGVKYYLRYVDDFVIVHRDKKVLETYKESINRFLTEELALELHPEKSKITPLGNSLNLLGFRVFYYHKLLRKSNLRKMQLKFNRLKEQFAKRIIAYDEVYNFLEGWLAYAKHANIYKLRKNIMEKFERTFPNEISTKEVNRYLKKL